MTGKLLQAAHAALDALVHIDRVSPGPVARKETEALREAIDQARTMEPVACMVQTDTGLMLWPIEDYKEAENYCEEDEFPEYLYTRPAPAQHDQQALELCDICGWKAFIPGDGCLNCGRVAHPAQNPLTDEQIGLAWSVANGEHNASAATKRRITRAIEAVHGIGVKP
jgi:hypothetical protein